MDDLCRAHESAAVVADALCFVAWIPFTKTARDEVHASICSFGRMNAQSRVPLAWPSESVLTQAKDLLNTDAPSLSLVSSCHMVHSGGAIAATKDPP
jgi:hypothetical protein